MEFLDQSFSRNVCDRFPRIIGAGITFPFDEVMKLVVDTFGRQNVFNFEIFFAIFDIKCRLRRRQSVRCQRSRFDGIEKRHMKNIVKVSHSRREFEFISLKADTLSYSKWTKTLPVKLF